MTVRERRGNESIPSFSSPINSQFISFEKPTIHCSHNTRSISIINHFVHLFLFPSTFCCSFCVAAMDTLICVDRIESVTSNQNVPLIFFCSVPFTPPPSPPLRMPFALSCKSCFECQCQLRAHCERNNRPFMGASASESEFIILRLLAREKEHHIPSPERRPPAGQNGNFFSEHATEAAQLIFVKAESFRWRSTLCVESLSAARLHAIR